MGPGRDGLRSAFLYDFDGLLVDSETAGLVSWRELYASQGEVLDEQWWLAEVAAGRGPCMPRDQLELLRPGLDWGALERARLARRDELITTRPGVAEHLAEARRAGLRLGVVSNAPGWWIEDKLPAAGLDPAWFEVCVTKAEGVARKPAADSYLRALRLMRVGPQDALAFEDSPIGVRAAKTAGLPCVCVLNDVTARLVTEAADLTLTRIDEMDIAGLLGRFRSVHR
jgi:HAD superfamily hydrolase (TIGR01509 family)